MDEQNVPFQERVRAAYEGQNPSTSLSELCFQLFSEQIREWPDLRSGHDSLDRALQRWLACDGFSVLLQHNPGRIKSTMAGPAAGSPERRPCFLCEEHLPAAQKAVLYREKYLILCNPRPVLSPHFTVAHTGHRTQALSEEIDVFMRLMADLGPNWTVLYNGPRCGASAPDHLHFQAVPFGLMPIEREIHEQGRLRFGCSIRGIALYGGMKWGRTVLVLRGREAEALAFVFRCFLISLRQTLMSDQEPMINVAGSYDRGIWQILVFPRRKHRPDAFFRKDSAQVVVSPGIVEMAGIVVTPLERDFERLDAAAVEGIYNEVSLEEESLDAAIKALRKMGEQ
jgi:hypothetical protein